MKAILVLHATFFGLQLLIESHLGGAVKPKDAKE
jgi:hypothetical protein